MKNMTRKFGRIPTKEKTIVIAVIEAVSQKILEETGGKLARANEKLLVDIERYKKGGG